MAGYNRIIVVGNLTRSPQLRYTASGTAVAELGLAVNRKFKQGDEIKEDVCFIDVTVFGKRAEVAAQYLDKGRAVLIEGRLQQNRWETPDGQKRSKHEIVADQVTFLPDGRQNGGQSDDQGGGFDDRPGYE